MAILVTEVWTERSLGRNSVTGAIGGTSVWRARRAWDVSGAANDVEAMEADGVAREGDAHPDYADLFCDDVEVSNARRTLKRVTATYASRQGGGGDPERLASISWDFIDITEETDQDCLGNPLTNSAGDAFSPRPTRTYTGIVLTCKLQQPGFDVAIVLQFKDRVNLDPIDVPGIGLVPACCMRCLSIKPLEEHTKETKELTVAYTFLILEPIGNGTDEELDPAIVSPHDWIILDQGLRARAFDELQEASILADIYAGVPLRRVTSDVRLEGHGVPFDSSYKVSETGGPEVVPEPGDIPEGAVLVVKPAAVYLRYQRYRRARFQPLPVF